jgi:uncharacterized membrane protein HdeD (DUF308 family)
MTNQTNLGQTIWQLFMVKGVVLLVTGLVLLIFPKATLATLVFIMGVYWFIDGIATVVKSFNERNQGKHWGWGIFTGILGILAGLVVLSQPMLSSVLTTSFLMWFIGISAIIYGLSGLFTSFQIKEKSASKTAMVFGSFFSILFGLILVSSPYFSAIFIIYTIGIIAIIGGLTIIVMASNIKKKLV